MLPPLHSDGELVKEFIDLFIATFYEPPFTLNLMR